MVYITTPYNDLTIQGKRVYSMTIKVDVSLFKKCNLYMYLYDGEKKCFAVYETMIEGDEYLNWEGDDAFILSHVNSYLQNIARNSPPSSTVTSKDSYESDDDDDAIFL